MQQELIATHPKHCKSVLYEHKQLPSTFWEIFNQIKSMK